MIPSILPTYNRAALQFVKGEGSWLIEADGRRFLDMGAGIAVNALGHAHPDLVAALVGQANQLWHVSNLYNIPQQQDLADRLVAATFADTVFFTNSGTESCELAVKMARKYWYDKGHPDRTDIIAFNGSFHGRSSAGIAAAGSEKMVKGFGPLLPGFIHLDWGDHDALKAAVNDRTAAILIEPVQGEGGIRPLPDHCLKGLRALCDETGTLLILDEVQCGMGRTGRLFAHEWAGVTPDIMMVAKGIGGGFPLGAVLATENAARYPRIDLWRQPSGLCCWQRGDETDDRTRFLSRPAKPRRHAAPKAGRAGRRPSRCVRGRARCGPDAGSQMQAVQP